MVYKIGDKVRINKKMCREDDDYDCWTSAVMDFVENSNICTISCITHANMRIVLEECPQPFWWNFNEIVPYINPVTLPEELFEL